MCNCWLLRIKQPEETSLTVGSCVDAGFRSAFINSAVSDQQWQMKSDESSTDSSEETDWDTKHEVRQKKRDNVSCHWEKSVLG